MSPKFREGDFVVTHDYRRGFVLFIETTYSRPMYRVLRTTGSRGSYSETNISLSGVEPTDEECAMFARYHIAGIA